MILFLVTGASGTHRGYNLYGITCQAECQILTILHCDFLWDAITWLGFGLVISWLDEWNLGLLFQGHMDRTNNADFCLLFVGNLWLLNNYVRYKVLGRSGS